MFGKKLKYCYFKELEKKSFFLKKSVDRGEVIGYKHIHQCGKGQLLSMGGYRKSE